MKRKYLAMIMACVLLICAFTNCKSSDSDNDNIQDGGNVSQGDEGGQTSEMDDSSFEDDRSSNVDNSIVDDSSTGSDSSESASDSSSAEVTLSGPVTVTYKISNSWENGGLQYSQIDMSVNNNNATPLENWTVKVDVPSGSKLEQGWNASYSVSGSSLNITPEGHNATIGVNSSVSFGFIIGTSGEFVPNNITVNGTKVESGYSTNAGNQDNQNNQNSNNNQNATVDVSALLKRNEKAVQGDDWLSVKGNKIVDKSGKTVWLTGLNWFGYNTGTNTFDGLWACNLEDSIKGIADHGFNLLRIPFSAELINQWAAGEFPKANYNNALNPNLNSMNSMQIFDYVVNLCENNGIKIMIDIHSAETDSMGHMTNLWYTQSVSTEEFYKALEWMAERYKNNDTIIAFDLKNEPHGKPNEGSAAAIWNNSKSANNWKYVAETAAKRVLGKNQNVLIMVEGIEIYPIDIKKNNFTSTNSADYYFNWWGGNLRGVKDYPINLGAHQNKLVYSPHDYGPTVYQQPWFKGNYTYQSLYDDCWKDNWLYIHEDGTAPLLIGEWGGFMTEPNITWMTYMRQLINKYKLHHTFWCYNANSGDTGGLVKDDFITWDSEKYNFVKQVLWQQGGKFVGLDHAIPLGKNGITLTKAKSLT